MPTHRGLAASLKLVTAHEDPDKHSGFLDWSLLARESGTLVFLMGAGRIARVLEPTRQGIFYQPDRWLGGSVFLFTVSQLGYRMLETLWLSPGLSWAEASARGLTPACLPGIVADAPTGLYAGAGPLSAPTPGGTLTVAFLPIGTAPDLPSRVFLRYCHAHECR